MEYYVTQPKDYWVAQNAINITLNALGDKNRIQCSVVSGAVIMCFLEDVKPASQGGDPENGDGLYYGVNHEPKRWPLSISPTYFNTDSHKYVYVAIPRSEAVGTQAVIVFPSEELDIYGRARRLLTNNETGEPLLNEDGEQQVSYEQIGSTDYFYIYLNGIISAPAVNAGTGREERGWERIITDWGKLETAQGREERQNSNEWFSYSQVNQVVTFLKEIAMGMGSSFRNLILNHKNLTDVATSETDYTDSDTMVATPGYVEKHYLSKSHDDSTPYSLTVGGILRAATGYITSLYSNLVQSTNYTGDGIADTGYRLTANHNGHSKLTIDEIYVRMKAVFESLEVRERTYAGGDQIWSCAGNRINRVDYLGNVETADHAPEMMDVHADGRPAGTGEGDVYSVPVPGDTYGYSYVKVPWLLRQMPFLLRHRFFGRLRRVRIILNEQEDVSGRRAGGADSQIGKIRRARCYFLAKDDDMEVHNWWRINDLARCQTMNLANTTRKTYLSGEDQKAGNIFWWRKVIGVSYEPVKLDDGKEYHYFDVAFDYLLEQEHPEEMAISVMEGSDIPAASDSVVQFGNTIIEGRMNLMMMEVNGGDAVGYSPTADAPCLKAYRGIYCFDLNKCWVGGNPRKMMLSPKSGYEFYGPNFKQVTEYDVVPVPVDRGLWLNITPTRDDYREHAMVRKCYYYDKVSHNGSYWLCSIVDGAHWVDGNGDYISDAAYSALTEEQKALCSRKQNYTIDEPSANSIDWTEVVQKGDKGDNMIRLDINNEMDMIPTTAALRIDTARTVETTVRLFDGATEVDISSATLSSTGGPDSSIATASQAADGKGKKLSWAFKAGQTMAEAYDITISYTYKNVAYTAVFTVSASKGEAVWQLKPSLSAIPFQRNADNTLTPASRAVGLSLVKIDGGSTATYTSVQTGLTVRYSDSSMPSSVSAGTGWSSGNITVANTADNLYIALFNASGVLLDRETIPVVKDGENGFNTVRLDINNEMDMIPTTSALRIDVARTVETTVRLFDGATEVDISAATLSPTGGPASSIATFSQAADGKGKKLSWTFKAGQTMAEAYDITLSYIYKNVAYTAVFTVSASKGEAVWQLKPSLSAIPFQRNADNTLTPPNRAVSLSLVKIDGGSTATYTSVQTGLTVRYSILSMPSSASAGTGWSSGNITVANTADNLYIAMFNASGVLLDRETIPVVKDGEKGSDGSYYVEDYGISAFRTSPSDISSWSSSQPSPTAQKPYVWKRTRLYNPNTQTYGTATYVCLTGEQGVNGKDGWMITANPANVIITQSLNNNTSSFSSATVSFTAKKGGTNATIASIGTPTSSEFVVSKSGNTVTVSRPQTHGSPAEYYTEGSFTVAVNVTDPDTGSTVTFNVTVLCYANLLGTWKESVEGGVKTVVAEVVTYDFLDGKLTKNGRTYTQTASAAGNYETWSSSSNTSEGSRRWMNEHINTAEENISTIQRHAVTRNLLNRGKWLLNESNYPYADYDAANDRWYDEDHYMDDIYSPVVRLYKGTYCFYGYVPSNRSFDTSANSIAMMIGCSTNNPGSGYTQTAYSSGVISNDTITINGKTYHRCWALFSVTWSGSEETKLCSVNLWGGSNEADIAVPCLCEGESPSIDSSASMIKQTADEINLAIINKLGETGINIDGNTREINLIAGKVNFKTSSGGTNPYISITSDGKIKATYGDFSGKITATGGSITGYLDVTGGLNVKDSGGSTIVQVNGGTASTSTTTNAAITIVDAGGFYVKRGSEGFRLTTYYGFQRWNSSANNGNGGWVNFYGGRYVRTVTSFNYTIQLSDDLIIAKPLSSNKRAYLPYSNVPDGKIITIINAGAYGLFVNGNGHDIVGASVYTEVALNINDRMEFIYSLDSSNQNNSKWYANFMPKVDNES